MSDYNVLKDNVEMTKELYRVFDNLKKGTPVPSHIWFAIKHPGIPEGQWVAENLEAFLEFFEMQDNPATAFTVWSNIPDKNPASGADEILGNGKVMEGCTLINLTDFIQACTQSMRVISQYHVAIINLIAHPWRHVAVETPTVVQYINDSIIALVPKDGGNSSLPHHDIKLQKKEYDRLFSALGEGQLVPSHWHLYLSWKGDPGGDLWNADRLNGLLNDMFESDENNLHVVWASEPMHTLVSGNQHHLCDERGKRLIEDKPAYLDNASRINLADFIWLCCQQDKTIYSRDVIIATMIILYPFRHAMEGDKDAWVEKTVNNLRIGHQALKKHIKH